MNDIKIALIQMDCRFGQVEHNVEKATRFVREAAAQSTDLVVLPEAFNTGYLGSEIPAMMDLAEPLSGYTVQHMSALAAELNIYLVAPIIYAAPDGAVENTAVLIEPTGCVLGSYSKTHPVGDERTCLRRGEAYPVWKTNIGKIGILICYDVCFPETSRMLALKDCELILVPAAWRASHYFKEWWDLNLACRALDNLVFVAAANRCGASGEEFFAGKSQVINPIGQVLCACGVNEEAILYQRLELGRIRAERDFNTVLEDRHPEDYGILAQPN